LDTHTEFMSRRAPNSALLSLAYTALLAVSASASTLLDPLPEPSTTRFGQTIVTMGDLNGDGVPDLAVAAPFQDGDFNSTDTSYGKPQNVGKIFLLDGVNLSILNELTDPQFEQIQPNHFGGQMGASMASVADLNGDGVGDLLVGVPRHEVNLGGKRDFVNAGEAFVFSGKDGALIFTLTDPTTEEGGKLGAAVAGLGDVDADGVPDLLVGVPGKDLEGDESLVEVGLAYVFSGKSGQIIRTLNHPVPAVGARFGSAVANAGDIDKDGVSDILIGAPGEGHAYVFSGKTGALLFNIVGPFVEFLHSFGAAVAGGMDFNRRRACGRATLRGRSFPRQQPNRSNHAPDRASRARHRQRRTGIPGTARGAGHHWPGVINQAQLAHRKPVDQCRPMGTGVRRRDVSRGNPDCQHEGPDRPARDPVPPPAAGRTARPCYCHLA